MPNTHDQLPRITKGCIGEYNNNKYYNYLYKYPCTKELFTFNKETYFKGPKYSAHNNYNKLFFPEQTKINKLKAKGAKGFYFIALVNNIPMEFKLDEGSTNTSMGIKHAKKLGLENIIAKPAIAEAVGNNVKILGKIVVNIKINEYLTQKLKIDMLNTESKYILLSNKHQSQIGISKDQKSHQILINNQPIYNQRVLIQQLCKHKKYNAYNGYGNARRLLPNLSEVYSEDKPSSKFRVSTFHHKSFASPKASKRIRKPEAKSKRLKENKVPNGNKLNEPSNLNSQNNVTNIVGVPISFWLKENKAPNKDKSNEPIQLSQQIRSIVTNSANKTENINVEAPIVPFWLKENKAPNSNKTELTSESNKDQQEINKSKDKRKQGTPTLKYRKSIMTLRGSRRTNKRIKENKALDKTPKDKKETSALTKPKKTRRAQQTKA